HLQGYGQVERHRGGHRDGAEVPALGRLAKRVEVVSAELRQTDRRGLRDPAAELHEFLVRRGRKVLSRRAPRGDHHLPGITGAGGGVDHQGAGRSVLRRVDVFVIPASVPEAHARSLEGWVEVHHHHDLSADVHVLVVVPAVLGRGDPVTDEHEPCVFHGAALLVRRRPEHQVGLQPVAGVQHQVLAAGLEGDVAGNVGGELDQRYCLEEAALFARRLIAHRLELRGEILDGQLVPGASRLASFELIVGEETKVSGDLVRGDPARGSPFRGGQSEQERQDGEGHGRSHYPGAGPVAMGRAGSSIQPLNDPTYSRGGGSPAISIASASWQAVTPLPQETITSFPYRAYSSRSSAGGRNRWAGVRFACSGALRAPGMCPALRSRGSTAAR